MSEKVRFFKNKKRNERKQLKSYIPNYKRLEIEPQKFEESSFSTHNKTSLNNEPQDHEEDAEDSSNFYNGVTFDKENDFVDIQSIPNVGNHQDQAWLDGAYVGEKDEELEQILNQKTVHISSSKKLIKDSETNSKTTQKENLLKKSSGDHELHSIIDQFKKISFEEFKGLSSSNLYTLFSLLIKLVDQNKLSSDNNIPSEELIDCFRNKFTVFDNNMNVVFSGSENDCLLFVKKHISEANNLIIMKRVNPKVSLGD